jgi:predicted transcriptional regulator
MQKLTIAEEEIMLILWDLEEAFVKEIIEKMPYPKPHYNTVSTTVRILQDKGFIDYKAFGKTHQYFAKISREQYRKKSVRPLMKNYFNNSAEALVSFFVKEKNVSVEELETLIAKLKKEK